MKLAYPVSEGRGIPREKLIRIIFSEEESLAAIGDFSTLEP
jgi:hypothetical protein